MRKGVVCVEQFKKSEICVCVSARMYRLVCVYVCLYEKTRMEYVNSYSFF